MSERKAKVTHTISDVGPDRLEGEYMCECTDPSPHVNITNPHGLTVAGMGGIS